MAQKKQKRKLTSQERIDRAQERVDRPPAPGSKWEAKEKAYQAGKAKIDKCRGKKGKALDACLKGIGRHVSPKTGEWEKIPKKIIG